MLAYYRVLLLLVSTWLVLLASTLCAQTVENINSRFDGEKIIITYDLVHSNANEKFRIDLYSSHDTYTTPLKLVTGAAGDNVSPGRANRVIWDAKNTLPPDFDGDISIRIRVAKMVTVEPLSLNPLSANAYKRGRTITITWTGGLPADQINLQLFQNNSVVMPVAERMPNSGAYSWKMPKQVKGKEYTIRLSNVLDPQNAVTTAPFRVKPATPFIVKALPVIAAGVVVFMMGSGDGGEPPPTNGDTVLPSPVRPGG
jgi:hypothetical protein